MMALKSFLNSLFETKFSLAICLEMAMSNIVFAMSYGVCRLALPDGRFLVVALLASFIVTALAFWVVKEITGHIQAILVRTETLLMIGLTFLSVEKLSGCGFLLVTLITIVASVAASSLWGLIATYALTPENNLIRIVIDGKQATRPGSCGTVTFRAAFGLLLLNALLIHLVFNLIINIF